MICSIAFFCQPFISFQDLHVLSQAFYRPFVYEVVRQTRLSEKVDRGAVTNWLNNEDVAFLFGNLETAYAIHAAFLTSLESQFSQWPNPGWGGFAGAFRMLFTSLQTMIASLGTNPLQLSRKTYSRLSSLPEFNELVQKVINVTTSLKPTALLTSFLQCESLPICAGQSFVSLYTVQYSKLDQLVKHCREWVASCDDEYFEKEELATIIKHFESFYNKSIASKRSAHVTIDGAQLHRQIVAGLAKRFSTFQVEIQ